MVDPHVAREWRRAGDCLQAATVCLEHGLYADAISRAYYSIMHAAKAALLIHGVQVSSHEGLRNRFGLTLIRNGLVEVEWAYHVRRGFVDRIRADYQALAGITQSDADSACVRSRAFLERMRTLFSAYVP